MKCPYCKKEINLREVKIRSLPENRYYFGVIVQILSDELGYSREEVHEICKHLFLSEVIFLKTKDGFKEMRIPKSTTQLKTIEFEDYLSNIRQWASIELSIYLPLPNERGIDLPEGE